MLTRRRFLQLAGAGVVTAAAGGGYACTVEPRWLAIDRRQINLSPPGAPVRILHLSDLHASREVPLRFIDKACRAGVALKPDAICVTGDFITRRDEIPKEYPDVLRQLSAAAPTFASLGNHDGGAWTARSGGLATSAEIRKVLRDANITLLRNTVAEIELKGRSIQFVGLGDLWSGECIEDLTFAALATRPAVPRVVLSHNPDTKERLKRYSWDLLLSGHTHGGQIGLPFFRSYFAPVVDKRYIEDLHRWEGRWLHISRGVGNLHGVRFNCRPQISLLTLA